MSVTVKGFTGKIVKWIDEKCIHEDVWTELMLNGNMAPYAPVLMIGAGEAKYVP